jgi:hypothetical protein
MKTTQHTKGNDMTRQQLFLPLDYGFRWTEDWYEYDGKPAEQAALKARNAEFKRLKAEGHAVRKFSLGKQLVSRGGIGSGRPHIELVVPCYGLEVA